MTGQGTLQMLFWSCILDWCNHNISRAWTMFSLAGGPEPVPPADIWLAAASAGCWRSGCCPVVEARKERHRGEKGWGEQGRPHPSCQTWPHFFALLCNETLGKRGLDLLFSTPLLPLSQTHFQQAPSVLVKFSDFHSLNPTVHPQPYCPRPPATSNPRQSLPARLGPVPFPSQFHSMNLASVSSASLFLFLRHISVREPWDHPRVSSFSYIYHLCSRFLKPRRFQWRCWLFPNLFSQCFFF